MSGADRLEMAGQIAEAVRACGAVRVAIAGSLARGDASSAGNERVSLVAAANDEAVLLDALFDWHGSGRQSFDLFEGELGGVPFSIRIVLPERFGALLIWDTGSEGHLALLEKEAARFNLGIDESGIHHGGDLQDTPDEETAYRLLGLRVVPPKERLGTDEITRHRLP